MILAELSFGYGPLRSSESENMASHTGRVAEPTAQKALCALPPWTAAFQGSLPKTEWARELIRSKPAAIVE